MCSVSNMSIIKIVFLKETLRCGRWRYLKIARNCSSIADAENADTALPKRPQKKPFIKNLLAGSFDEEFLIYPEVTREKLRSVEMKYLAYSKELPELVNSKEIVKAGDTNQEEMLAGKKLNWSESIRMSEAVSSLPSSVLLQVHKTCVEDILSKYGTDKQKRKYLPRLLSGELSIAFALSEDVSGSDPSSLKTNALRGVDDTKWTVNGVKTWITNAEFSDLFLIFSKYKLHEKSPGSLGLSVFIVNRKTAGLSVEKISTYGLEECGISNVILKDVIVSDEDRLGQLGNGYEVATHLLSSFRYNIASCFSSNLKSLLNDTVKFISPRKQTLINIKDCESIKKKLSDVFLTIYTLDSMLYMTSGLLDKYEIETDLEAAVIHLYCVQNGMMAVDKCLEVLGSRVFDNNLPYAKLRRDFKALTNVFHSVDLCKLFISLTGIQHATQIMGENVRKLRNSFNYPSFFVKKIISNMKNSKGSPKLNLKLYMNVHPSLVSSANQLEFCVLRLQYCVEQLLVRHGSEIAKRQLDLERLSNIIVDVYCMTAVISRASRSYCTGIRFSDDEILLAKTFCQDASTRCKEAITGLLQHEVMANDVFHLKISDHLIEHGGYFIEHPLTQNIG